MNSKQHSLIGLFDQILPKEVNLYIHSRTLKENCYIENMPFSI